MYNKKSDYALNKQNPEAIVYTDADRNEILLTRDDFESEAEFLKWKAWSDADYHQAANAARGHDDHTVSLIESTDSHVDSPEDLEIARIFRSEQKERDAALAHKIKMLLTPTQYRRFHLYYVDGLTEQEIADVENVGQGRVSKSLAAAKRRIMNYL